MARLDVYRLANGTLVLDVQSSLHDQLKTRVVVPLLDEANVRQPIRDLNPVFEIDGRRHVMATQALAAVLVREFGQRICSLNARQDEIIKALDMLFTGF